MSSWTTEAAPWRSAVPRQSAPVSPPPTMTTCLPSAVEGRAAAEIALAGPVGQRQVVHGLVDPGQLPARHRQLAPRHGPDRDHHGVVSPPEIGGAQAGAHRDAGAETGAFRAHLLQPPLEVALLQPELGNPVPQETAGTVIPLVHRDRVPGPGELLGTGQPGGAGADDGDGPARRLPRWPRCDVTALPGPVGDGGLDVLDRHRGLADGHHAGGLARGRAEPAGELGEVVGGVQPLTRPAQSPRQTRSFHSGMRFPSGQPWWQNGMPQSMQRPACASMIGSRLRRS